MGISSVTAAASQAKKIYIPINIYIRGRDAHHRSASFFVCNLIKTILLVSKKLMIHAVLFVFRRYRELRYLSELAVITQSKHFKRNLIVHHRKAVLISGTVSIWQRVHILKRAPRSGSKTSTAAP